MFIEAHAGKLAELEGQGYKLYSPEQVSSLDIAIQMQLAKRWTQTLNEVGGNNTFHPPSDVLLKLMQYNHAAIIIKGNDEFVSGAKIQPWGTKNIYGVPLEVDELTDVSLHGQVGYTFLAAEVGGMATIKEEWGHGAGGIVAETMAKYGLGLYSDCPQTAVVRPTNFRSAKIFHRLGWVEHSNGSVMSLLGFDLLGPEWAGSLVFINPRSINA